MVILSMQHGVGTNSLQGTSCMIWVHMCSGVKGISQATLICKKFRGETPPAEMTEEGMTVGWREV